MTIDTQRNGLVVQNLYAGYGKRDVIFDVNINVLPGEIVGVVGHNGAGKSTLLKSIFRSMPIARGNINFGQLDLTKKTSPYVVAQGISFTPAELPIFRDLTVQENLELGAFSIKKRATYWERLHDVTEIFPVLGERLKETAGRFSGGQQRQLSIGMALMTNPKLMMLDEPSLGISPSVVQKTFQVIRDLAKERDSSVLIVEQNVKAMTQIADRIYVLRNGEVVLEETREEALSRDDWWDLF